MKIQLWFELWPWFCTERWRETRLFHRFMLYTCTWDSYPCKRQTSPWLKRSLFIFNNTVPKSLTFYLGIIDCRIFLLIDEAQNVDINQYVVFFFSAKQNFISDTDLLTYMRIHLAGIYWWLSLLYIFIVDKHTYLMGGNSDTKSPGTINPKNTEIRYLKRKLFIKQLVLIYLVVFLSTI